MRIPEIFKKVASRKATQPITEPQVITGPTSDDEWAEGKANAAADRAAGYPEFRRELRRWDAAINGERSYIE